MKKNLLITMCVAILGCTGAHMNARVVKSYYFNGRNSSGVMEFVVDSVDFRKDLTRVYGKLKGAPHTSHRIDNMNMRLMDGTVMPCADIDGVDMQRWFQWEDDGLIPVEIDFGTITKIPDTFIIVTSGPKGECQWPIINGKKSKRLNNITKKSTR